MFKRAYLFSSNAPLPEKRSDKSNQNEMHDMEEIRANINKPNYNVDDEGIKTYNDNKVAHCIYCRGKTLLNEDSISKHIKSKNHIKNVRKNLKKREAGDEIRNKFNKRMEAIDCSGKF